MTAKIRLDTTEMRTLQRSCGVTKLDEVKNAIISGTLKVTEISTRGSRLQWCDEVTRRDGECVGGKVKERRYRGNRVKQTEEKLDFDGQREGDLTGSGWTGGKFRERAEGDAKNVDPVQKQEDAAEDTPRISNDEKT